MILKRNEVMPDDDFYVMLSDQQSIGRHSHDFLEFVYVQSGSAEHTINGRSKIISKGDYFLINIKSTHEYRSITGGEPFSVINCLFRPAFIGAHLSDAGGLREILDDFLVGLEQSADVTALTSDSYHDGDGFVGALVRRMLEEQSAERPGGRELVRHLLVSLLICLVRNAGECGEGGSSLSARIKRYVAENYMHPIRLSEISRELSFSLAYTSIRFSREAGMSFRDYLTRVRMEKAADLIRTTDRTVSEIASLVGYEDDTFFYRAFRRSLGMTPMEYKRACRQ